MKPTTEPLAAAVAALERLCAWASLGRWCFDEARGENIGDIDGGAFQDEAERLGILVRVKMDGPCGEDCRCLEYHGDPPWECLREALAGEPARVTPEGR